MKTLLRCCVLRCLIWVYTACLDMSVLILRELSLPYGSHQQIHKDEWQTIKTLLRCCVLRRLIRVYTACSDMSFSILRAMRKGTTIADLRTKCARFTYGKAKFCLRMVSCFFFFFFPGFSGFRPPLMNDRLDIREIFSKGP